MLIFFKKKSSKWKHFLNYFWKVIYFYFFDLMLFCFFLTETKIVLEMMDRKRHKFKSMWNFLLFWLFFILFFKLSGFLWGLQEADRSNISAEFLVWGTNVHGSHINEWQSGSFCRLVFDDCLSPTTSVTLRVEGKQEGISMWCMI